MCNNLAWRSRSCGLTFKARWMLFGDNTRHQLPRMMVRRMSTIPKASQRLAKESLAMNATRSYDPKEGPLFSVRSLLLPKFQIPQNATPPSKEPPPDTTFHAAVSRTLVVCQCFGVLPVGGVTGAGPAALAFRIRSARVLLAGVFLAGCLVVAALSVVHMAVVLKSTETSFMVKFSAATPGVVFYGNACAGAILFLRLATKWPLLMAEWHAMERALGAGDLERRLSRRINLFVGVIMTSALVEHLLSILVNTPEMMRPYEHIPNPCPLDNVTIENTTADNTPIFKAYCCRSHQFIFSTIHYSLWSGLLIFVCSKVATFTWNFQDVFVILISVALVERFKQMNARLMRTSGKHLRKNEWGKLREDFATLSSLVKSVDNEVSAIVMLSFCNNLYFICLQLLNGISPNLKGWIQTTYFFGSFLFLLARAVAVTMFAAGIHDSSRVGLPALYKCPSESYCVEVHRLQSQLAFDDCALTGLKFFSITRNFMLAVAGAIFTYEVVLIQFK